MDSSNLELTFDLAVDYYERSLWGNSLTHFQHILDSDEASDEMKYAALCYLGNIYLQKRCRWQSSRQCLTFAITYFPDNYVAYALLAKSYYKSIIEDTHYQLGEDWMFVYSNAELAYKLYSEENSNKYLSRLLITYDDIVQLKIDGMLHINKHSELQKFIENNHFTDTETINLITFCVNEMGIRNPYMTYDKDRDYDRLRFKFDGIENIEKNYSRCMEDMFVLSALNGKRNGTFIELGTHTEEEGSNTLLLEKVFGWKGYAVDYDYQVALKYNERRDSLCVCYNACEKEWTNAIKKVLNTDVIDYVQIYLNNGTIPLYTVLNLPFHKYKFNVLTITYGENNDYNKTKIRNYLSSKGYALIVNDISWLYDKKENIFEDWFVSKDLLISADNSLFNPRLNPYMIGEYHNVNKFFFNDNE